MGEKRRTKSKGKTAKAKNGLRPHELRQQQEAVKNPTGQQPSGADNK